MELREVVISHYGPLRDIHHNPKPGLHVFFGPNESGKTLLMDSILKLLLGRRIKDFSEIDRVPEMPQGRITLFYRGREYILDGSGTSLEKITGLDGQDLRNIFVIRNKDLTLVEQSLYLSKVNDKLTGMQGNRIQQLKEILRREGRLTNSTSTAKLSNSSDFDKIDDKVRTASILQQQIQDYIQSAREQNLDQVEGKLIQGKRALEAINIEIRQQEQARVWQRYTLLSSRIQELRQTEEKLKVLKPFTTENLKGLQDLESRKRVAQESAQKCQEDLQILLPQIQQVEIRLEEAKAKTSPLMSRKPLLDQLQQQITLTSNETASAPQSGNPLTLPILGFAVLGLALAILDILPTITIPLHLILGLGALILVFMDKKDQAEAKKSKAKERKLCSQGASLGIMAKGLDQLASAISQENMGLETALSQQQAIQDKLKDLQRKKQQLEETHQGHLSVAGEKEHQLAQELNRHGVSLHEFSQRIQEHNNFLSRHQDLQSLLQRHLKQPNPLTAREWQETFSQEMEQPEDPQVAYDRDKLLSLGKEKDRLIQEIEDLNNQLGTHQDTLNNFATKCAGLPIEKETGKQLPIYFSGIEILDYARQVLEEFQDKVNQRFTAARTAIELLESIQGEDQQKLQDLIGPGKPIQSIFSEITGGAYTQVVLNPQSNILVENAQGIQLPATSLSQGTMDQLYLALRLSLAKDILGGEAGFLLLDDAFLCADTQRIKRMLDILKGLATKGWHILYFTMDQRLADLAQDIPITKLSPNRVGRTHSN